MTAKLPCPSSSIYYYLVKMWYFKVRWNIIMPLLLLLLKIHKDMRLPGKLLVQTLLAFLGAGLNAAEYNFRSFTTEQGLSQNTVTSILQDEPGFIWIGTKDGLNRFDGLNFKTYRHDKFDSLSLGNGYIHSLYDTGKDKLLVGADDGLYIFDKCTETFRKFSKTTLGGEGISHEVMAIKQDRNGIYWIASRWQGLFKYDPRIDFLSVYHREDNNGGLSSEGIWDIFIDNDGILWLGTVDGGLNRFDPKDSSFEVFPIPRGKNDVMCIIEHGQNSLIIGSSETGVYIFDKDTRSMTPVVQECSDLFIRKLLNASDRQVWIGTEEGLYIWNQETGHVASEKMLYGNNFSLTSNSIYSIFKDREGGMWIGTYFGGINYTPPHRRQHFYPACRFGTV